MGIRNDGAGMSPQGLNIFHITIFLTGTVHAKRALSTYKVQKQTHYLHLKWRTRLSHGDERYVAEPLHLLLGIGSRTPS